MKVFFYEKGTNLSGLPVLTPAFEMEHSGSVEELDKELFGLHSKGMLKDYKVRVAENAEMRGLWWSPDPSRKAA